MELFLETNTMYHQLQADAFKHSTDDADQRRAGISISQIKEPSSTDVPGQDPCQIETSLPEPTNTNKPDLTFYRSASEAGKGEILSFAG